MFLLVAGTVVVTSMDNVEMDYLRDGDHFGEVALALDLNRVGLPEVAYRFKRQNRFLVG